MVSKIIPKEAKVIKRVDTNLKIRKSSTKAELLLQVKKLKETNDALEINIGKKIELLESFEAKINNLEEQMIYFSHKDIMYCKESQTEAVFILKCEECDFEGRNERELGWHIGRNHDLPLDENAETMDITNDSEGVRCCKECGFEANNMYNLNAHKRTAHSNSIIVDDRQNSRQCNCCDKTFTSIRDLMIHKKKEHAEKVSHCWHFSAGTCPYRDEQCWFIHTTEKSNFSISEYTCNICEKVCSNQSNFLQHRKKYHEEHVASCNNFYKGECTYGNGKCWFNHNDNKIIIENEHENKDVMQRIFKIMETSWG